MFEPVPAAKPIERHRFVIQGQVQGVGFRPFVYGLAHTAGLSGSVKNGPQGVIVEVQGPPETLDRFAEALGGPLPPLARITSLVREPVPPRPGERDFSIAGSEPGTSHSVLISPDTATCEQCLEDIADPAGRRYRYPFTNCTNCGPRYTITRSIPYDRASTSMACFALCPACREEYEDPSNRRFHAQPNACPVCGPKVWLVRNPDLPGPEAPDRPVAEDAATTDSGAPGRADGIPDPAASGPGGDEALAELARLLIGGGIAAIKGLGGFHLACDARSEQAVARLRQRKNRPHKPFALMAESLEDVRRFARLGPAEEALLLSPERPIVLCPLSGKGRELLASGISPDTACVGVMLPYTPLHTVLFAHLRQALAEAETRAGCARATVEDPALPVLVMTSGNRGGEPICLGNREALERLGGMAEAFLFHDRDILIRADDSVLRPLPGGATLFLRRARGFVPRALPLPAAGSALAASAAVPAAKSAAAPMDVSGTGPDCILGAGAELKNALCLSRNGSAFVSQHIGDMNNLETAGFQAEIREHLADLLRVSPRAVVRDLHPDYLASRLAETYARERNIPVLRLQHHFAHAWAVLAENEVRGPALVLALDGTGLGDDGTLWGGELLFLDAAPGGPGREPAQARLGRMLPLDLPGGESAIREPWRIAHALLLRLGLLDSGPALPWLPAHSVTAGAIPLMLERGLNSPRASSCGRLFDAVSALLGLCLATTYEGQAAIRLEEAQYPDGMPPGHALERWLADNRPPEPWYDLPFTPGRNGLLELDAPALFASVRADQANGTPLPIIARRFHWSLARGLARFAAHAGAQHGVTRVGLSGGCLQNATLAVLLGRELEQRGLTPLTHKALPPGDGCLSYGQAAWARLRPGP